MVATKQELVDTAVGAIRAAIWIKQRPTYVPWKVLGERLVGRVAQTDAERTWVGSEQWKKELEGITGVPFVDGNKVESLADGPAFFAAVKKLIHDTPRPGPIYVHYRVICDDVSGTQLAKLLAQKQREGHDVRVLVDGKASRSRGAREALPILRAAGVPVVLWQDPDPTRAAVGTHEKYIVTPLAVVTGGSNVGDSYTHAGPAASPKWSDTNVLMQGPVTETYLRMCEEALAQVDIKVPERKVPTAMAPGGASASVAVIEGLPGDDERRILLAMFKMLEGTPAGETVCIKNGYYTLDDLFEPAFARALARGVNIELFGNSPSSIDEPRLVGAILDSMQATLRTAERVKAAKGDLAGKMVVWMPALDDRNTVHDKLTVAPNTAMVMTENWCERSETLDRELANVVVDAVTADEQKARWNKSLEHAVRIDSSTHPILVRKVGYEEALIEVFRDLT